MAGVPSVVSGEIDLATADEFRFVLHDLIDRCYPPIVHVDLAAVTFIDSAGYHALVEATEYARRRGHVLVIRNLSPPCARVLRVCDDAHELHIGSHRGAGWYRFVPDYCVTRLSSGPWLASPNQRGTKMLGTCRTALGDVDRTTASFFEAGLRDVIDHAGESLVRLELSRVRFRDAAGYRVLLGATAYAIRHGHTLVLHNLSPSCAISTPDMRRQSRAPHRRGPNRHPTSRRRIKPDQR